MCLMSALARLLVLSGLGWLASNFMKRSPSKRPAPPSAPKTLFEWNDDRTFEWYLTRRTGYSTGARDSYSRYDQTIASVSAGAIVLSITFLKDVGYTPTSIPWLYASWIAFLVAGGASLYSLRTSADSDIERLSQLELLCKGKETNETKATQLGQRTVKLNQASFVFFLAGILLAIMFAFVNYPVLGGKEWLPIEKPAATPAYQKSDPRALAPAPKDPAPMPKPLPATSKDSSSKKSSNTGSP
jgi:hypothetical protein